VVEKITSGSQTGADRAALDSAILRGIPHGGWRPAGRKANATVTWQSVAGVDCFLERSTNRASPFTPLATSIIGQASTTTFTDADASRFTPPPCPFPWPIQQRFSH